MRTGEQILAQVGIERPPVAVASPEDIAAIYQPVDWRQAWTDQPANIDWLIEEFLEKGTVNALFAKPGTGKSLLTLEVALDLARNDHIVVYVDEENRVTDLVERLQAFGVTEDELDLLNARLRTYNFAALPPLDTARGGQHLEAIAIADQAVLVVLDTTTRMIQGKENDSDTFLQLYRCSLKPLKARGITSLRLDHPGKDLDRGQRGSSAKDGDVDTVWKLTTITDGLRYRLHREKSRSGHGEGDFILHRKYDPLCHIWSAPDNDEINTLCGQLDQLGLPLEAGRPTARKLLTEAGIEVSNTQLEAAIRLRKAALGQSRAVRAAGDKADRCPPVPHIGTGSGQSPAPKQLY
jgi:AAA domain